MDFGKIIETLEIMKNDVGTMYLQIQEEINCG
jgi:hypothetical protein